MRAATFWGDPMQRTFWYILGVSATIGALAGPSPAFAQYGAIAYDVSNGRWGYTFNHRSQQGAQADALRRCDSPGCEIRLTVGAGHCGALATTENRRGYGWAIRPSRDSARFEALENCQKHNAGQCVVRVWECNS
jgi:hypothetical protein